MGLQMGHAQYWHAALWGTQQLLALGTSVDLPNELGNSQQTNMTMEKQAWMKMDLLLKK